MDQLEVEQIQAIKKSKAAAVKVTKPIVGLKTRHVFFTRLKREWIKIGEQRSTGDTGHSHEIRKKISDT
jgi:hypothetical protein